MENEMNAGIAIARNMNTESQLLMVWVFLFFN